MDGNWTDFYSIDNIFFYLFRHKSDYLRNKMSQDKVEAIREDMKRHRDSVMKTEKIIQDTTQVQNK